MSFDSYTITCTRCEAPITHVCTRRKPYRKHGEEQPGEDEWVPNAWGEIYHDNLLVNAIIELLIWRPEQGLPDKLVALMKGSDWYSEDDEEMPFFSQSVIYPLLDSKEDARGFFCQIRSVVEQAGFDWNAIQRLAYRARQHRHHQHVATSGGLARELPPVTWRPEPGWPARLAATGVGSILATVKGVRDNDRRGGMRDEMDWFVFFEGGGRCHARRLLRIAKSVHDAEGSQVWPVVDDVVEASGDPEGK